MTIRVKDHVRAVVTSNYRSQSKNQKMLKKEYRIMMKVDVVCLQKV